jgi:hypothetical protein
MATIEAEDMLARGAPAIPRVGILLLGSQELIFGAFRQDA